jgi:AcrR family transcriptional regulator
MTGTRAISRKEQILQVAAELFRQKGYAATSMRDIAGILGIEAASLYHHIRSKEDLLDRICFGMAEQLTEAVEEVNDIYFNAEDKLSMLIRSHVEIITGNMDQTAVFMNEWKSLQDPRLSDFKLMRDQYEGELRSLITQGIEEDVFADVDRKFAVLTILSVINSIYQWYQPGGDNTPAQIAEKLTAFIMSGLRKKRVTDTN